MLVSRRNELGQAIQHAVARDELSVHYQPVVDLQDRRILGCESLLPWKAGSLGEILPDEFIPVAEETGLIVPIGNWVVQETCRQIAQWRRNGDPAGLLPVSVNLSNKEFWHGGLLEHLDDTLAAAALEPQALVLEITEGVIMDNAHRAEALLDEMHQRGLPVHIDDFGTGYSSLARLQHLRIDVIKLDRAFVQQVDTRPEARAMAAAIFHVSTAIGATIVAEGVETEAEARTLLDLGYTSAQGYLFARPMPIDTLMGLVRSKGVHVGAKVA